MSYTTAPIPFDNHALQRSDGTWHWGTPDYPLLGVEGHRWRWSDAPGFNLFLWHEEYWYPLATCKSLEEAALYSEGFRTGFVVANNVATKSV